MKLVAKKQTEGFRTQEAQNQKVDRVVNVFSFLLPFETQKKNQVKVFGTRIRWQVQAMSVTALLLTKWPKHSRSKIESTP